MYKKITIIFLVLLIGCSKSTPQEEDQGEVSGPVDIGDVQDVNAP
ncbi:MAG: glycoside hydrolase family 16 protein, partial [Eudoraea sp.]|nr:glycoside hydrolase family 16 protein [Eudoraea sp.]